MIDDSTAAKQEHDRLNDESAAHIIEYLAKRMATAAGTPELWQDYLNLIK